MNMQTTLPNVDAPFSPAVVERVIGLMKEARALLSTDPGAAVRSLTAATGLLQDAKVSWEPGLSSGLAPWQMRRVQEEIERRIDEPISNTELAAVARLSLSHFGRAFRRSFGVPPHSYVLARRVARARTLMSASEEPLAQVAASCGFFDQAHFSKIFRQIERTSPNDWRRRLRGMDGARNEGSMHP